MTTQSRISKNVPVPYTYRKLIVKGETTKSTYFLLGYMPSSWSKKDFIYLAKTKGLVHLAEWDERFIPPRDRELVKENQVFYMERAVTGAVVSVQQLHGIPEKDLSHLYGHIVPESKPRTRVRTRNAEQPKARTRKRTRRTA